MIVHLTDAADWAAARAAGRVVPASLATEGFVHCSAPDQVIAVADRFYRGRRDAILLVIDPNRLGSELRWEAPVHPDGRPAEPDEPRFPHVYGPLELSSVVSEIALPCAADGSFPTPPELVDLVAACGPQPAGPGQDRAPQ